MTEQEELELLKQNSPMALPDDPSASGWSTDQIKRKFYTGLLVLYDFFKASRNSQNGNIQSMQEIVDEINTAYNEIMNQETILKVKFDMDGNEIVTTYAKLLDIANGTVAAVKYLAEDGTTKKYIYELENALTTLTSNFNLVKEWADNIKSATSTEAVQRAVQATKDSLGNVIKDTYATINSFTQISTNVANIINGTTIVDKAYKDQNGNVIDNTYETKANVDLIKAKIPNEASSENQLADKSFVNSSISTATATYRGSYNLVSDLSLTISATESSIATALGTSISTADNNDYCYVHIPVANDNPTVIARVDRYKNNGTAWAFEYSLNNSGYTSDQWAAINSGITSALVAAIGLNTSARHTHDNKGLLDTYTQTESDLSDAVGKKHTHSNKTVLDSITEADINNISNSLYNLGVFDTISGNTITRQTGYVDLGSLSWTLYGNAWYSDDLGNNIYVIASNTEYVIVSQNYPSGAYTNISNDTTPRINCWQGRLWCNTGSTSTKPSGLAQYKLATSYPEEIIPNQPLLNLDSNGCNFLREEWEKGLNLFDANTLESGNINASTGADVDDSSYCRTKFINVKPNTTYAYSKNTSSYGFYIYEYYNGTFVQFIDGVGTGSEITIPSNVNQIRFKFNGTVSNLISTQIMLNEGSHAYPYQEYNGAIVREKDIEPVLLWENSSPNSAFAGQDITIKDSSSFKYLVLEMKRTSSSTHCGEFIKIRNSVGTYAFTNFADDGSGSMNITSRSIYLSSTTSVHYYDGILNNASNNDANVPIAIYGTNVL